MVMTRIRCSGNDCPGSFRLCCTGCPTRLDCPPGYEPCLSGCDADLTADCATLERRNDEDDYLARGEHDPAWLRSH